MRYIIVLALSAACMTSCITEIHVNPTGVHVWVATEPIQCLNNPWERDWLESNDWDYSRYPKDPSTPGLEPEEFEIIQNYYDRQGVEVSEAETNPRFDAVCLTCSCPEGHTLYLFVRAEDVEQMIEFGYRKEAPKQGSDI